jgi:hypothetical protein
VCLYRHYHLTRILALQNVTFQYLALHICESRNWFLIFKYIFCCLISLELEHTKTMYFILIIFWFIYFLSLRRRLLNCECFVKLMIWWQTDRVFIWILSMKRFTAIFYFTLSIVHRTPYRVCTIALTHKYTISFSFFFLFIFLLYFAVRFFSGLTLCERGKASSDIILDIAVRFLVEKVSCKTKHKIHNISMMINKFKCVPITPILFVWL